jgi:acyl-CoA synthetase (NDP forming)
VSHPLDSLFFPRGVVVVGSTAPGRLGYQLARQLVEGGFQQVFAVNPRAQGVSFGSSHVPGYAALAEVDHPLDLAVVVSPTPTVAGVLEACGRAGVRAAAIITAGFSEAGDHAAEAELKRVAGRYGIRFVGPNCAGIVNTSHRLYPTLETPPPPGGVAVVAQSGAVGGVFLAWAKELGLGISKFVSYGNGADLNEIELLEYLAGDPETKVVALYIESVGAIEDRGRTGREFMRAVEACTRHKPLVVIKAGRTGSGRRATLSHTGSMAGADAVYDAALRQCGAIRVHTIEELFDLCKGFHDAPPVQGRRVAILTNSGGPAVLAADRAEEVGLQVAEPGPETRARLAALLPTHCALQNPIDLTVEGTEEGYRETLSALLDEYDAVLALNIAPPYLDSVPLARGICDAAAASEKPVLASFLPRPVVDEGIVYLQEHGVPNFLTGERAVAALARMADYQAGQARRRSLPEVQSVRQEGCLPGPEGEPLLEPEAMAWLAENGFPVPEFRFVTTRDEVAPACRALGYPVVMKVVAPAIVHKSDLGGVVLDLRDERAALEAWEALRQVAAGKDFRGVILYPMIRGAQEVLLGLSRDPQFGPVVAFGLGGIYTEVWHDVALRVAPVDRDEAMAMIREIESFPLLRGVRGQAPRDLEAVADLLVNLSRLPFRYPDLGEIDLNPVFLFSQGLVVGDVRVIRRSE